MLSKTVKPLKYRPGRGIEVRAGERGRGVFATKDFKQDDTVEKCPTLKVVHAHIKGSLLLDYVFDGGGPFSLLVLGYGMLYNHDEDPNLVYAVSDDDFVLYALRDISKGEELTISYGDGWWSSRQRSPA